MMDLGSGRDWEGENREPGKLGNESVPAVNHSKLVDGSIVNIVEFVFIYVILSF